MISLSRQLRMDCRLAGQDLPAEVTDRQGDATMSSILIDATGLVEAVASDGGRSRST
jgi:hypothetical protein